MVTFVAGHAQPVVVCFVCHRKRVVLCVRHVPFKVLQFNSQFDVGLTCQSLDLVQPEPELAVQVTEALFVVGPVSIEVDGAVESFLEDSPAPSCFFLVAENVKVLQVIRIDLEDTAGGEAGLVAISAVLLYHYNAEIKLWNDSGIKVVLHRNKAKKPQWCSWGTQWKAAWMKTCQKSAWRLKSLVSSICWDPQDHISSCCVRDVAMLGVYPEPKYYC